MSGLTPHQRAAANVLFGLPEAVGFALAGGSALVALGVVDRQTRDLDAFVAARRGSPPGDVAPLFNALKDALVAANWTVETVRQHDTFARLLATLDDNTVEIDLAVDSPPLFPLVSIDDIPSLAPEDIAARKVLAILDRAEGRDFTDLRSLAELFGNDNCISWAQELDSGVTKNDIAVAFAKLDRLNDSELPCGRDDAPDVRRSFMEWQRTLSDTQ